MKQKLSCSCENIKIFTKCSKDNLMPCISVNQKRQFQRCKKYYPIHNEAIDLVDNHCITIHQCTSNCYKIMCNKCRDAFFIFNIKNLGFIGIPRDNLTNETNSDSTNINDGSYIIPKSIFRYFTKGSVVNKGNEDNVINGYDDFDLMFSRRENLIIGSCKNDLIISPETFDFPLEIKKFNNY